MPRLPKFFKSMGKSCKSSREKIRTYIKQLMMKPRKLSRRKQRIFLMNRMPSSKIILLELIKCSKSTPRKSAVFNTGLKSTSSSVRLRNCRDRISSVHCVASFALRSTTTVKIRRFRATVRREKHSLVCSLKE